MFIIINKIIFLNHRFWYYNSILLLLLNHKSFKAFSYDILMTTTQNIFIYQCGPEYNLISILRDLIYAHSKNGKGYEVHLISDKNIKQYIKNIPEYFSKLCYAHQADFVRVNVICDYGGIWLDSDTLVLDSLDSLFDLIDKKNGFFIKENNELLSTGIFGSKANLPIMNEW